MRACYSFRDLLEPLADRCRVTLSRRIAILGRWDVASSQHGPASRADAMQRAPVAQWTERMPSKSPPGIHNAEQRMRTRTGPLTCVGSGPVSAARCGGGPITGPDGRAGRIRTGDLLTPSYPGPYRVCSLAGHARTLASVSCPVRRAPRGLSSALGARTPACRDLSLL
jgi:hypothetical protein